MVNYSICKRDANSLSHLPRNFLQVSSEKSNNNNNSNEQGFLQILLFINKRPGSQEQIQAIRKSLNNLEKDYDYPFEFQVIDVQEQPYMAEHFKLIATPALLKIYPEPRQTLTGTDLIAKLEYWWPRWQRSIAEYWQTHNSQPQSKQVVNQKLSVSSIDCAAELMQMSDEIFRLKQEKEQLQAQLRFKDRIVAMLAHDLRNPLTAVSLALETLESTQKTVNSEFPRSSPTLMERLIKQARYQVRVIDRMITDILERPRGKSTQLQIQPEKLDLGALCREVIISFRDRLKSKDLHLKTDIPNDLPLVYADRERIRQVIVNLLDNAIKYTPKQGKIQVLILDRTTQKIQVTICDSGPGIPKENHGRIFEDSFRLKRDESQEGYGIGLALCQRIILSHYGKIWVESSPNNGSCFQFTLPVYR
ncbi:MAG: histidine kinase [Okeania sp. SIO2C2]|uniref:histidine kinase n=1 Tax=Okeania sp. SIO2C2 TaxID=2607787 RepID=UPI0013B70073|nr:histidine kinase [Okeania sp. SIO2C2]NEP86903.1 histidine kinase [Okeania sp. SIO2C2]